jgi:hypothetical protein
MLTGVNLGLIMTQLILYNVFNGLIIGAFYALMALGLSLILNLSGVDVVAHLLHLRQPRWHSLRAS